MDWLAASWNDIISIINMIGLLIFGEKHRRDRNK